jgi:hypothetical protein
LVLAPSEEKSTVVLVPPFGTKFTPTMGMIVPKNVKAFEF